MHPSKSSKHFLENSFSFSYALNQNVIILNISYKTNIQLYQSELINLKNKINKIPKCINGKNEVKHRLKKNCSQKIIKPLLQSENLEKYLIKNSKKDIKERKNILFSPISNKVEKKKNSFSKVKYTYI